ncbi:hypothetical protein BDZ45DRAFT_776444 [Acephala macrosclerotiorum]|nr:hypothetical protein BDZ45DRAFT_776444 [Acephala macrosclerotiorum]
MSNPHIQLETFGGHREDGVVNGDHSKDDATHPLLDEKKPSIWSRIHHASKIILSALPRPSHSRMLVMSWILCCLLLVLHILAVSRWPRGDYGIGILRESFDCGSGGTAFVTFFITIPMNGIATLLVYILGLVAKRSSLILKITAILMCVPTHLLYNSLFFPSTSAYDAYEVLVSNDFLHRNGTPFDLTTLQLRPTVGKFDPIQNDYNMSLPELNNLTISITALQTSIISNQKQLQWTNLTFSDCLKKYQAGTYDSFSNVILISNWTTSSNANNSALGLTILSGQTSPKHRIAQSLVSLCPESFFSAHNRTEPQEWDYIQSGANGLFDAYAPKNFSLKQENVFVESCFSQDIPQRCRLLYSPLVLKIATACLVVTLACVSLSIFFGHHGEIDTDSEITTKAALFIPGSAIVLVAFIIQFFLTAFSSVTELGPRSKSDQGWLLNVY